MVRLGITVTIKNKQKKKNNQINENFNSCQVYPSFKNDPLCKSVPLYNFDTYQSFTTAYLNTIKV